MYEGGRECQGFYSVTLNHTSFFKCDEYLYPKVSSVVIIYVNVYV